MLVRRSLLFTLTAAIVIMMLILTNEPVLSGAVTIVIVMAGYIAIAYAKAKKRLNLLEEECNPQAFIDATKKQMEITGKSRKTGAYLTIDIAAGRMIQGNFIGAKELLDSIDQTALSVKNGTLMIYTINLITCLYELGETAQAEELFETKVPTLAPVNRNLVEQMELLIAERYFFLNKYEESTKKYQVLQKNKMSRRKHLEILFRLAQMEEASGDIASAGQKYRTVSKQGASLWVAIQAKERLAAIREQ